jgi:hypothetical protein
MLLVFVTAKQLKMDHLVKKGLPNKVLQNMGHQPLSWGIT